jgi:hypothetical protein
LRNRHNYQEVRSLVGLRTSRPSPLNLGMLLPLRVTDTPSASAKGGRDRLHCRRHLIDALRVGSNVNASDTSSWSRSH